MYHAFTSDSAFKSVPTKGSEPTWQTSMLYSYIVLLIYINETVYLYGNLPFFKIDVNRFMAWDDSPGAKIISKCILWMRSLVPFWVLRHFLSLISRLLKQDQQLTVAQIVNSLLPNSDLNWRKWKLLDHSGRRVTI